jgi:diguanylate cyclase (GGDEF)-like protein
MLRARGLFASVIGRRLIVLFVIAAFVPLAAMMALSVTRVSSAAEAALEEELVQNAKSYGMQLLSHLARVQYLLEDAVRAGAVAQGFASNERLADFEGIAVYARDGRLENRYGDVPAGLPLAQWSATLAQGKAVLTRLENAPAQLLMLRQIRGADGAVRTVVAALKMERLWGRNDTFPAMTDFCVATSAGVLLNCSRPVTAGHLNWSTLARGGARLLSWDQGGETLRAGAWTLFIESRFADDEWIILAIQPEAYALQAAHTFRAGFVQVTLVALLIVLLVSSSQIRRILVPLQQLLRGTRKVAGNNFDTRIVVVGHDEFGQLATAFNDMSARLGTQFRTFAAFADIDRTILTTLDLGHVATTAARCVRDLAQTDVVSIALIEPGNDNRLRVYGLAALHGETFEPLDFEWDFAQTAACPSLQWTTTPSLPPGYIDLLRESGGREFALVPFARGAFSSGVVVLGHATGKAIGTDTADHIGGLVDRLAIALAAVARDRKLHEQAHFDALTGLPNRYYLLTLLGRSLARAQRQNGNVAALVIDLDNFKRTNDALGHSAGDRLLQAAATRIRSVVREDDVVARLGGDEFAVVLDHLGDPSAIGEMAQKAIQVLSEPFDVDGQDMYLGATVGIAIYPTDATSADELLKSADTAMYRAKSDGRGSYAFFEDRMNTEASERTRIDRELRLALQRDELVLHFQPLLDLRTGRLHGAEALVRWMHPQRGLLGPGSFIAVAEESGLIEGIGSWVLERSCEQLGRWRAEQLDVAHISVNVSSRQLQRPDFFSRVLLALERNNLPANVLVLEVTESLFTDEAAVAVLRKLQELGVRIAVDDFGTGYSSFAYLRTLPISILKIDRTFIVDVETNDAAATVAAAIINMAQALGKEVVAEGVETEGQVAFLDRAGCELVQGYVVSRPIDAVAFATFVRTHRGLRLQAESTQATPAWII